MSFRFPSCNTDCVFCFRSQDFVYLTVGFKSLSYELQEEKLVYDIYAMFGKLQHWNGNMKYTWNSAREGRRGKLLCISDQGPWGGVRCKRNSTRLPVRFYALLMSIRGHVVVKFYPSFKFYFPLFQTHYGHTIPYPKTKENNI